MRKSTSYNKSYIFIKVESFATFVADEPNLLCAAVPNAISRAQNMNINFFIVTL